MAQLDVLFTGYVGDRVAGTVSLVRSQGLAAIVDPGMVPGRNAILDSLRALSMSPEDVTDVILSHHHPDHTVNVALFPDVRIHDHWAVYEADLWTSRPAEGLHLAPGVSLLETPGHTPQDVTTLVDTPDGVVALTHLWWHESAESDPLAWDLDQLHVHRSRVLDIARRIVPGHGPAFDVGPDTPR